MRISDGSSDVCSSDLLATGAGLVVLIQIFGPVSGAHFNPAVTLVMLLRRAIAPREAGAYAVVQVAGAILGTWLAHTMFAEPIARKSVVSGKSVSVRVDLGGRRILKKKKQKNTQ